MSDEDKIGFTYATLDHYVLTGECEDEEIRKKIDRMHMLNLHKLQLMPSFALAEGEQEAN
jgi:NAD+ synthase